MTAENSLYNLLGGAMIEGEPLKRRTTMQVGGPARWYWAATDLEKLVQVLKICHEFNEPYLLLGHGSNVLVSDSGYNGIVIQNKCKQIQVGETTYSESGAALGTLFHETARAGYAGLEWAAGVPGSVGGALVSNAGAYRGSIGPLVRKVRVFHNGEDKTLPSEWMEFSYRNSRLRKHPEENIVLLSCWLELHKVENNEDIFETAKGYQKQRAAKQPHDPSSGSFFKNVNDKALAGSLPNLPDALKEAGVVPAGYLIESCGLKGIRLGGAQVSEIHANFLVNATKNATAADIDSLATLCKERVRERFGVNLEPEVLYVGDWTKS
jgi:UDP-N-acetylmuramate dehydrogenase